MYRTWKKLLLRILLMKILLYATVANSLGKHGVMMRMSILEPVNYTRPNITLNRTEVEERTSNSGGLPWLNEPQCGIKYVSSTHHSPRIVGGKEAVRGDWPWMAMILRYYKSYYNDASANQFTFICGGTLIQKQWVISAAHCFSNNPASYTQVALGAHRKDLKDGSVKRFVIAKYICHHLFIGHTNAFVDDLCLIKLAGEVQYTNYIKPICLPTTEQIIKDGESCQIAGWGDTQGTSDNSVLQNANVLIQIKTDCEVWYREAGVVLPQDHFCAGYPKGGIDSCQGDSGGPLTCMRQKISTMFGITSFGIGCARKHRPGVYADVKKYMNWIQSEVTKHSGKEACFSSSDLLSCSSTITRSGTKLRTPIEDSQTWMYPPDSDCIWNVAAPKGFFIRIVFECFFHVEINPSNIEECYDYMAITSAEADIRSIYCGSTLLNPITINSNQVAIKFKSDSTVQSSGFVVRIEFVRDPNYHVPTTAEKPVPHVTVNPRIEIQETRQPCNEKIEANTTSNPCVFLNTTEVTSSVPETLQPNFGTQPSMREAPCKEHECTTASARTLSQMHIILIIGFSSLILFVICKIE